MKDNIDADIVTISQLSRQQRLSMLRLMTQYYDGITEKTFNQDLDDKSDCILLCLQNDIVGFSTLKMIRSTSYPDDICVYSGDTIIAHQYWGQNHLALFWCQYINQVLAENPDKNIYWLLTSKGIKTYRFLPLYFSHYYPNNNYYCDEREKNLKAHLDCYAKLIYEEQYNSETQLITPRSNPQRLKKIPLLAATDNILKKGAHFFYEKNPDWQCGTELASIVYVDNSTLTRAGKKAFARLAFPRSQSA